MRLAEDKSSYKAGGVVRRDARHDPSQPTRTRQGNSRRNKQRWCKGRVGVEHLYGFWEPGWAPTYGKTWEGCAHRVCANCGKVDHYWWPRNLRNWRPL